MEPLRTFVALDLPEAARTALATVQRDLLAVARGRKLVLGSALKWVDPEGIHLTLKFLGYVDADKVGSLASALDVSVGGSPAARLRLAGMGAFPNLRQPRVLWVGLDGDVPLVRDFQQRVERALAPLGFAPEGRAFSPHLTLARVRDTATPQERRAVAELAAAAVKVPDLTFLAATVNLMKSTLHPSGAQYEPLHSVSLHLL